MGEVVVEERTEVGVEVEEGGIVEVEVRGGKEKGKAESELIGIKGLLLSGTVGRGEPAGESTELEAEQSVVANRR